MSLTGVSLLGVCVALLRKAAFGTDPFTCLIVGVANIFHTTYGTVYPVLIGIMIVYTFFADRHYIGIATVLNLFIVGPVGDLAFAGFNSLYDASTIWIRIITLAAALILLCFASSLYIAADLGVSGYDALSLIMSDKLKGKAWGKYRYCRIFTDLVCVTIGYICSAAIGIGTVITAFFMGPFTQWCIDHIAFPMLGRKTGN